MKNFSATLLKWYQTHKRDLPWRRTREPYHIWICEIIMQQTRISQGLEYYLRFIDRFPSPQVLAEATEDEVLKYWQGLGYYSRARNLHAAAKSMNGVFPETYEEVRSLKGVGDYTAAAICSISYNMPYAVVDGNVYRVLSRWMGMDLPIDSTQGKKQFALAAQELLDKKRPALYNQAIMDFGALQCTPASPDCPSCPLVDSCLAWAQGKVDALPVKQHKTKTTNRYFHYIYVRTGEDTWIRKRTDNDIWRNLYEPLLIETETDLTENPEVLVQKLQDVLGETPLDLLKTVKCGVRHVLSHRIIHANFYELRLPDGSTPIEGYQQVAEEDLHNFAVSNLVYQFFSLILEPNHKKE